MKKYRFGFSWQGMVAFLLVMLPNFIWMFAPPATNLLALNRMPHMLLEMVSSVLQGLMFFLLAFILRKEPRPSGASRIFLIPLTALLAGYYILWICCYAGVNALWMLVGMAVLPCLFFILFAVWKKNYPAMIPIVLFSLIHFFVTCANY